MKKQKNKSKSLKNQKNKTVTKNQKKIKQNTKNNSKALEPVTCLRTQLIFESKLVKATFHNTYEIKDNHELFPKLKNLISLYEKKEKTKQPKLYALSKFTYFPSFEFELSGQSPSQYKCSICQFEFESVKDYEKQLMNNNDQDIVALRCSHMLHMGCLKMLLGDKDWLKCPVCSTIYGRIVGDQPMGKMSSQVNEWMHCDGYNDVGTIVINYHMNAGKKGNISFPSTSRTAYLPNNKQGKQIQQLLRQAFDRKLIFTIGRSVTTGRDNQIVWNGVHHKTNTSGGAAYFGYPDPTYFDRVKLQLAAKGIS